VSCVSVTKILLIEVTEISNPTHHGAIRLNSWLRAIKVQLLMVAAEARRRSSELFSTALCAVICLTLASELSSESPDI
jgi:hypothetical protein